MTDHSSGRWRRIFQTGVFSAIFERLVSRGSAAAVGLIVAAFVAPEDLGAYALVLLPLTLLAAVGDQAIRQIAARVLRHEGGRSFIRTAAAAYGLVSAAIMSAFVLTLAGTGVITQTHALSTMPLVLVPVVIAIGLDRVCGLQRANQWGLLARKQAVGSGMALLLTVPLSPLLGVGAASIQMLLSEIVMLILIWRTQPAEGDLPREQFVSRYLLPTSWSGAMGWLQGQSDRVVLSSLGALDLLGQLSIASSLVRSPIDAALTGYVTHLRIALSNTSSQKQRRAVLGARLPGILAMALMLQVLVTLVGVLMIAPILGPQWSAAVLLVPLLAAGSVPVAVTWVLSASLIDAGQAKRMLPLQLAGIALSVLAGFAFWFVFQSGALVLWIRDVVACSGRAWLTRDILSWRIVTYIGAGTLLGGAISVGGYVLGLNMTGIA